MHPALIVALFVLATWFLLALALAILGALGTMGYFIAIPGGRGSKFYP